MSDQSISVTPEEVEKIARALGENQPEPRVLKMKIWEAYEKIPLEVFKGNTAFGREVEELEKELTRLDDVINEKLIDRLYEYADRMRQADSGLAGALRGALKYVGIVTGCKSALETAASKSASH